MDSHSEENKKVEDKKVEDKKVEDKKNKLIFIMQSFFIYTVKNLVTFLKTKSEFFDSEKKLQTGKEDAHRKLRVVCEEIIKEFENLSDEIEDLHAQIHKQELTFQEKIKEERKNQILGFLK